MRGRVEVRVKARGGMRVGLEAVVGLRVGGAGAAGGDQGEIAALLRAFGAQEARMAVRPQLFKPKLGELLTGRLTTCNDYVITIM